MTVLLKDRHDFSSEIVFLLITFMWTSSFTGIPAICIKYFYFSYYRDIGYSPQPQLLSLKNMCFLRSNFQW
jgi:hypothetical protein